MDTETGRGTGTEPGWYRNLLLVVRCLLLLGAIVVALWASFLSLRDLARYSEFTEPAVVLVPLAIDLLALAAWVTYLTAKDARRRDFAYWSSGAATLASIAGNTAGHMFATGSWSPNWITKSLVGAVPALVGFLVVHMVCPMPVQRRGAKDPVSSEVETPVPAAVSPHSAATDPVPPVAGSVAVSPRVPVASGRPVRCPPSTGTVAGTGPRVEELAARIAAEGWTGLSGDVLVKKLGTSKANALKARRRAIELVAA